MWFCSWLRVIEPDDFEEAFILDWVEVFLKEDGASCLEPPGMPKDLEPREAALERPLVCDCGPFEKLAGSTRFLGAGWGRELGGSAFRF